MKNLYEILGITSTASTEEIKKAYRTLALSEHPDKGGDSERMGLLNEAYLTLSDQDARRNFDADWRTFQEADVDAEPVRATEGLIEVGTSVPYSQAFRQQHQALVEQYGSKPLEPSALSLPSFQSDLYHLVIADEEKVFENIFTLVQAKATQANQASFPPPTLPLTPIVAIKCLLDFLSGNYYGAGLIALREYLSAGLATSRDSTNGEQQLYEGILDIILMAEHMPEEHNNLISSLSKITDFAKKAPESLLPGMLPLFYNKFFRNLYAYALHLYWYKSQKTFEQDDLNPFDGLQTAKELLRVLRERLTRDESNEHLRELIRYVKLLYQFEKDSLEAKAPSRNGDSLRAEAFHYLDWIPVFIEQSTRQILVNLFLQIGTKFQHASRVESEPARKMADETMALNVYLIAVSFGNHATPDVEIYANSHVLSALAAFQFKDTIRDEIFPALQKRTLATTDMFPFFEGQQSNIAFLQQGNAMLHLMRRLLNALVQAYEYNKTHAETLIIDHAASTVLYHAYEACLKNWYQETYDPNVEKQFRIDLMDELLFEHNWSFLDVEQHLMNPFIMVDRDAEGWRKPTSALPYSAETGSVQYRTINGAEVNHTTGAINFFMTPWTQERHVYDFEKLFSLLDIEEMLARNLDAAVFSLDPVDPLKPHHPFNAMRFAPSQLCESELLSTMLLTDYYLKFFTTNQEVQGQHPFDQRPVAQMLRHVPAYLRRVIEEFQKAQHVGAVHRFWIEADDIEIAVSDEGLDIPNLTRIHLGDLKMRVKTHRMERDIHGELKDTGDEEEGWPIYVLTSAQMRTLLEGKRQINGPAMIFIYAEVKLFYWENNKVLLAHAPKEYQETLNRLFRQPRETDGRVKPTKVNTRLLYRITTHLAEQTGLPHRYSAEFIFAHKFTVHYDEFAQFFPEFGRLKELSKISALIRYLNGIRRSNQEIIDALDYLHQDAPQETAPASEAYRYYSHTHTVNCEKITALFVQWRTEHSEQELEKKWSAKIEPFVSKLRSYMSAADKEKFRRHIYDTFYDILAYSLGRPRYKEIIDNFMKKNSDDLLHALIAQEKFTLVRQIACQYPKSERDDIRLALFDQDEHLQAINRIAIAESRRQLGQIKATKKTLEEGFLAINLGRDKEPVDLKDHCPWVPASVRHEVRETETAGRSRHSFFVYGGVRIQSQINVVKGGNAPLSGSAVGGGAFNRGNITRGFQSHHIVHQASGNHRLLQAAGFNIHSRANLIFLPTQEAQHPTRTIHRGAHTKAAREAVATKMQNVLTTGQAQNWSQAQYRAAVKTMLSEMRQELRAGNIALNSKHRPWAK